MSARWTRRFVVRGLCHVEATGTVLGARCWELDTLWQAQRLHLSQIVASFSPTTYALWLPSYSSVKRPTYYNAEPVIDIPNNSSTSILEQTAAGFTRPLRPQK